MLAQIDTELQRIAAIPEALPVLEAALAEERGARARWSAGRRVDRARSGIRSAHRSPITGNVLLRRDVLATHHASTKASILSATASGSSTRRKCPNPGSS